MICFWFSQKHVDESMSEILRLYRKFVNFTFLVQICVIKTIFVFARFWCNWIVFLFNFFRFYRSRISKRFRLMFFFSIFSKFDKIIWQFFLWKICFFCALFVFCFSMTLMKILNHVFFCSVEIKFDFLCLFFLSDLWILFLIFSILS